MAFDAFVLGAVSTEIEEKLIKPGAAVSKIYQLNPTDLLIYFKGTRQKGLYSSPFMRKREELTLLNTTMTIRHHLPPSACCCANIWLTES